MGSEPYFPLFAYGYGLRYAAPRDVGLLPEAEVAPLQRRDSFIEQGHAGSTWSVSAESNAGTVVLEPAPATAPGGALRLAHIAKTREPGSLAATWTGKGEANLILSGAPIDLVRQTADDMVLSLTLRVDESPSTAVILGMGCGDQCQGRVDITKALRAAANKKGWTTIAVPLACLRAAGANVVAITAPVELSTGGKLALRLGSAGLAPEAGPSHCP
jgi:beta-glucosidase